MGDSRIFQRFRKGKKDGPRKLPCLFRWRRPPPVASSREGAKRPADGNKSPNDHFVKTSRHPCENRANGHGTGTERKCANHTRPRKCRMKAESRFPATFCRPPRNAMRQEPAPLVSLARGMTCKRTNGVCTRADSIQSRKCLPKPCFSPLSAPAGTALRQKSFVFAESGSFLCGKRFCFYRGKATAGTEKCSIRTVPPPVF